MKQWWSLILLAPGCAAAGLLQITSGAGQLVSSGNFNFAVQGVNFSISGSPAFQPLSGYIGSGPEDLSLSVTFGVNYTAGVQLTVDKEGYYFPAPSGGYGNFQLNVPLDLNKPGTESVPFTFQGELLMAPGWNQQPGCGNCVDFTVKGGGVASATITSDDGPFAIEQINFTFGSATGHSVPTPDTNSLLIIGVLALAGCAPRRHRRSGRPI
jgi:hypothetical protein